MTGKVFLRRNGMQASMIPRELHRTAVVGHRPNQAKPYCSETRATVSKADALANAKSAARPLTKGSGSGRSSSGAASIAAPAPITAAGQGRTGQATAAPRRRGVALP